MRAYKKIFLLLAALALGTSFIYADDRFTVQDIHVDVTDVSAIEAKMKAIIQGQREAFKILIERLLSPEDVLSLPEISDAQLDTFLQDFEVQNEKNSAIRYIGTLTLRFDPSKIRDFLAHKNKSLLPVQRNTISVVVPIYEEMRGARLWEEENLWREAWNDYSGLEDRYIIPIGDLDDRSNLSLADALKGETKSLSYLMQRYQAGQVIVTVLKHDFPFRLSVYIYNEQGIVQMEESVPLLGEEKLTSVMIRKAIEKTLDIGKQFEVEDHPSTTAEHVARYRVLFNSHKEWLDIQRQLSRIRAVRKINIVSLKRHQALISLEYINRQETMENALKAEGFTLTPDPEMPQCKLLKSYKRSEKQKNFPAPDPEFSGSLIQENIE